MKLINKDTLVAEIEKRVAQFRSEKSKEGASMGDKLSLGGRIAALEEFNVFINTLDVKEVDLENRTKILADIIFDAAKHGYMPYDTQDEYCAMEKARRNIIKLIQ